MSKRRLHVPWRKPLANPISQCIDSEQWDQVIGLAQSKPELVKHWTERSGFFEGIRPANVLPIHEACANESVPVAAIEALIQAYPESIKVDESAYHRLPLHIACRKTANISVVRYLLEGYANACLEPDALGRLPIHYAISNGANDDVVSLLLKYNPNAARGVDGKGWTPLHVACNIGASTRICTELLELYPEASVLFAIAMCCQQTRGGGTASKISRKSESRITTTRRAGYGSYSSCHCVKRRRILCSKDTRGQQGGITHSCTQPTGHQA
jgi:Ankyrin repeats (3 copies)